MSNQTVRLEVMDGEAKGQIVDLSGISIIGRDAACALVIPSRAVSREHAVIRPEEGFGFVIEDLDSRAGTFVNGMRTRKAVLQDGDTISMGGHSIRVSFTLPSSGEVSPADVDVVKSRFMPTARLSLDAVKVRMRARDLGDPRTGTSGEGAPAESGDIAVPLAASAAGDALRPFGEVAPEPGSGRLVDAEPLESRPIRPIDPGTARLEALLEVATSLAAIHDPTRLARETALRIFNMFPNARRVGLFELEDEPKGGDPVLRPRYVVDRTVRGPGERVQVSQSVLQLAVAERRAVLSEDVAMDPRLSTSRSLVEGGVTSIVCAPLVLGERVLGALYVDSTDREHPLEEVGLRVLVGVAAILAAAFENARLFARVQTETVRRAALERYFSPDLVARVLKGEVPMARSGLETTGTILFVDIRGFTRITELTAPPVLVATLNAYFAAMQRTIFRSGGTVERFGGDSILAYWGVVDSDPAAPLQAMRAALSMQVEVFRLNPDLVAAGRPRLQVAVGLNTGTVIAGDVGSPERYEFTILGDAANLARRLETQAGPWEVIAGAATIQALRGRAIHRALPPVMVKNKEKPVDLSVVWGVRLDPDEKARVGVTRWDLAIPAWLDARAGKPPVEALAVGLVVDAPRRRATLELFTVEDPIPGTPVRLTLHLPRAPAPVVVVGRVQGASSEDTLYMTDAAAAVAAAQEALQRLELVLDDAPAAFAALGITQTH